MDVLPLGLVGDPALGAVVAADREVNRMAGVRADHLEAILRSRGPESVAEAEARAGGTGRDAPEHAQSPPARARSGAGEVGVEGEPQRRGRAVPGSPSTPRLALGRPPGDLELPTGLDPRPISARLLLVVCPASPGCATILSRRVQQQRVSPS